MAIQLHLELQMNPVADEVSATTAVVRPILQGLLYSLKRDFVDEVGGYENVKLKMLNRLHRPGDGDCGICFEYAVHDALNRKEPTVIDRMSEALKTHCNVPGSDTASILFGAEKSGALRLIDTVKERLTDDSRILTGIQSQPPKLKLHIQKIVEAFRKPEAQLELPWSIRGLWKADLFVGNCDSDRWVAATVKINQSALKGASGLRIGIVPNQQGKSDLVRYDESKNLVVCPLPYDHAFMETFYQGWTVVQQFVAADANVPKEPFLPRPPDRQVAKYLAERREFTVVEVLDALVPLAQPELLEKQTKDANTSSFSREEGDTSVVEAPVPTLG